MKGTSGKKDEYQNKKMTIKVKGHKSNGKKCLIAKFVFNLTHFVGSNNSIFTFLTPCKTVELGLNITLVKKSFLKNKSNKE